MNVQSLPLSRKQIQLLSNAGYSELDDFKDVLPTQLSEALHISHDEALGIIGTVKKFSSNRNICGPRNAFELFEREKSRDGIVTFCEPLDVMLGGGVPTGKITEICGSPGIGKTQMGMQLAVDVQIPEHFGGLQGKAIYIDTEGSFVAERVRSISAALVKHLNAVNTTMSAEDQYPTLDQFSVEHILSNIHLYRCQDYIQLIAVSHLLPDVIQTLGQVKLIVVDSIAFPFRHDFENFALRARILSGLAHSFLKLAHENDLAVVFMNQMTTSVKKEQRALVPALGESWGHACTIRVILFWEGNSRLANLYKSPSRKETTVPFQINGDGVRGVPEPMVESMLWQESVAS